MPRKQPFIYWRPVAFAATVSLLFVVGVVLFGRTGHRSSAADHDRAAAKASAHTELELSQTSESSEDRADQAIATPPVVPAASSKGPAAQDPAPSPEEIGSAKEVRRANAKSEEISAVPETPAEGRTKPTKIRLVARETPAAPGAAPPRGKYGTQVDFVDDPAAAAKKAAKDDKLLFILHIAGNFEDSGFT
jgi:hypothetical protein